MSTKTTEWSVEDVVVGPDGQRYLLRITGEAAITRGPLGRFIDLADQIRAEGLEVPQVLADVLETLQRPNNTGGQS